MKKFIVVIVAIFMVAGLNAQSLSTDINNQPVAQAGDLLVKSSNDLFVSLGFTVLSGGMITGAMLIKDNSDDETNDFAKKALVAGGIIAGAAGITFYIFHIIHLQRAGKILESQKLQSRLKINSNPNGIGLVYNF